MANPTTYEDLAGKIQQLEAACRKSEERYNILVENANEAILVVQDGLLRFFNQKALTIAGYSRPEDYADRPFVDFVHPDHRQELADRHRRRIRGEAVPNFYQAKVLHKNRSPIWLQLNVIRTDWNGRPASLAFIYDISEMKRAEDEIRRHRDHLEELVRERTAELTAANARLMQARKMEAIGTLAAGIAHDFNNILNSIFGYVQIMDDEVSVDSTLYSHLQGISVAARRAADIVRQILAFSRKTEREHEPVSLQAVIREVLRQAGGAIPPGIAVVREIDPDCGMILADSTAIFQALSNLLTNAVQAMTPEGGTLCLGLKEVQLGPEVEERPDPELAPGKYARLEVSDTGHGMDRKTVERIFEPYFTTKKHNEGTGLGLAIVHGIVASHRGGIVIDSRPGRGTAFSLYFPVVSPNPRPAVERKEERSSAPPAKLRILFVDDEEMSVYVWEIALRQAGYVVRGCADSSRALRLVQSEPQGFDLVITDQRMPAMTGVELARELLKIRPDLPVILVTGWNDPLDEEEARAAGIRILVNKPHELEDLVAAIDAVCPDRRQETGDRRRK